MESLNDQIFVISFSRRSLDEIKKFLAQYCMDRISAGYFILQDPLSSYYETLCTGLDWVEDFNIEGILDNNNQNNSGLSRNHEGKFFVISTLTEFELLLLCL